MTYLYGWHAVEAVAATHPGCIIEVLWLERVATTPRAAALQALVIQHGLRHRHVSRQQLDKLTDTQHHQGVVAHVSALPTYSEVDVPRLLQATTSPPLVLVLDGVQDPHNLGACLRNADAAGAHLVLIPKDRAVSVNATVLKVASGAQVPCVTVTNLARALKGLREAGLWLYGTSDQASDCFYDVDFSGPAALVMGAEQRGLRRLTMEACDQLLYFPMHGAVSSLNVSAATAVGLFEIMRQRRCGFQKV